MKKIIRNGVMMAALLATTLNYANATNDTLIGTEKDKTIITLDNVKEGNQLLIKDSNGLTIYRENIKSNGQYEKGFDLTSLPNGDYYFELIKDLEIRTMPFNVLNTVVVFDKEKEVVIYKPTVRLKNNSLMISRLSLAKEPLELKIYYDNKNGSSGFDELIYSEEFEGMTIVEKTFKLDRYKKGNYKVVITSENRTFIEKVKL
jgi:hypothetical protein